MQYGEIIGNIDLALVALYAFWIFFALLIIYLQRENMREGYPLVSEVTGRPINVGPFPLPRDRKKFLLPHGKGEVDIGRADTRDFALRSVDGSIGSAFEPTGNPLVDGVGPAAWAERADHPDLDLHGRPKIVPMRVATDFSVVGHRKDPRGWPVFSGDERIVGAIKDLWVDRPEHCVRFVEIDLGDAGTRLAPMGLVKIVGQRAEIDALYAQHFAGVPQTKSTDEITLLEEEKISAYYCGGKLYASADRQEPLL
jgi:photosynthetic reaction center H subunit